MRVCARVCVFNSVIGDMYIDVSMFLENLVDYCLVRKKKEFILSERKKKM